MRCALELDWSSNSSTHEVLEDSPRKVHGKHGIYHGMLLIVAIETLFVECTESSC